MTDAGTSSRRRYGAFVHAICIAMSFTSAWNFSFLAVKSVSQLTSTSTPIFPPRWMYDPTAPSVALRPAFLPAVARPFWRSQSVAFSMSPPVSSSAFLQSIIPAPVFSRSSLTIADVTSAKFLLLRLFFGWGRGRLFTSRSQRRLALDDRTRRSLFSLGPRRPLLAAHSAPRSAATAALVAPAAPLGRRVAILDLLALGLLRLARVVRLVPRLALDGRVRDLAAEETNAPNCVVISGDYVLDPFRIAVRVDESDDRDPEPRRLVNGDVLLLGIDHEQAPRQPRHLLDAAQVLLQFVHLVLED